jgi:carboxypeptidase C (cathepsin A)
MNSITKFLRKDKVREAFGVDKAAPAFVGCSNEVGREFQKVNDFIIDTRPYVANLLHSGIRALIYVGTYDWICNFVGNERVFGSLDWKGLPDFRYQQENNKQVWSGGLWWESGPLRYARVNGAGHMVPWDKPVEALWVFDSWVGSFSTETNVEQKNVQGLVREEGTGLDAEVREEKHKTWEDGRPELVSSW